jgi:hypothetical protein
MWTLTALHVTSWSDMPKVENVFADNELFLLTLHDISVSLTS